MSGKKMGRPTDCPKPVRMGVRIDPETLCQLDDYCEKHNMVRSEAVRLAVNRLIQKRKKL